MSSSNPKLVIVLSGKRKSGKDFVGSIIEEKLDVVVLRIAGPIKAQYAKDHQLDFAKLLDSSGYKEIHRKQMVDWSDNIRKTDPDYFLRLAIEETDAHSKPIWMLTDARREADLVFFGNQQFKEAKIITIRVVASEEVRKGRGWVYTPGIDDAQTECGLDNYTNWDIILKNESMTKEDIVVALKDVFQAASNIVGSSKPPI